MRVRHLALALILAAPVAACGDDGGDLTISEPFSIATYNVGLAHGFVDYAEQRRDVLGAVLAEIDADVICLQEVWLQEDIDAVLAATGADYPHEHHVFLEDTTVGAPACGLDEATPLRECVDANCDGVAAGELFGCVQAHCIELFLAVSGGCQGCMATQLGNPVEEIFSHCTTGSSLYSYDGASGVIMLSKHAFSATHHAKLDSSLTQRAVLGATLTLPGDLSADVYCTHIAADLSATISYQGAYESFEGENTAQAEAIVEFVDATSSGADLTFITGDFNSGVAVGGDIVAELPNAAYRVLVEAGYVADMPLSADAACTYCADNTLIPDSANSVLIDHVFSKGLPSGHVTSTRIGTGLVEIVDGNQTVQTNPSDHYGVKAVIE